MEYNKIISLVPSLTELLFDFGLKDNIAGRTRFCIHPENEVDNIPIIGGTKNPRIDKIRDIVPDLIIANKEENRKEDIEPLKQDFEVALTEISTIEEAVQTITQLGTQLNVKEKADTITAKIKICLAQQPAVSPLKTVYFIWKEPWMTVGGDTYVNDVMERWNLNNIFGETTRYPELSIGELEVLQPELILLSSEPYPFKEKHIPVVKKACPDARILLVNGEWFSWYGSRMVHAFERLNTWRRVIDE